MQSNVNLSLPEVRGQYRNNVSLANSTWFGVGGAARVLFKPEDTQDLSRFLKNKPKDLKVVALGRCSNVIMRDGGVEGVVIKLGRAFNSIDISDNTLTAGAAVLSADVANVLAEHNLSGLEFLVGIPGSIGGAVAMNAGCYGAEVADYLIEVEAVNIKSGEICSFSRNDIKFTYRENDLTDEFIFTKASFQLKHEPNADVVRNRIREITESRSATQPIKLKTGGSTFKNPSGTLKAWQLIDGCGLRGFMHNGAQVSEQHCNFLINTGTARAKDLEELGDMIINKVYEKYGIMLEWEIKRIGIK